MDPLLLRSGDVNIDVAILFATLELGTNASTSARNGIGIYTCGVKVTLLRYLELSAVHTLLFCCCSADLEYSYTSGNISLTGKSVTSTSPCRAVRLLDV